MTDFIWYQVANPVEIFVALLLWRVGWELGGSFVAWINIYLEKLTDTEEDGDKPPTGYL